MQSTLNESGDDVWPSIAPLLDTAVEGLGEKDRRAIVLRFYEGRNLSEVGAALGASESAAEKRVSRAVERLRKFFTKRGVTLTAAAIAGAVSVNSVHAAPAGLAAAATAAAVNGAMVSGSTLALIEGALKLMAWTKAKTVIVVGAAILATGTTVTVVVQKLAHPNDSTADISWADDPRYWVTDSRVLEKVPPVFILRPTKLPREGGGVEVSSAFGHNRIMFKNTGLSWLLATAYTHSEMRCVFPPDLPGDKFDLMYTLSGDYKSRLREELKTRFGLAAHMENRTTEVLSLQVKKPNAVGLKISTGTESSWNGGQFKADVKGQKIDWLIGFFEVRFGLPIVNRTGLAGRFDINLQWQPRTGQSEKDALREALLNQLGLELVPTREKIETLVVEKVK